MSHIIDSSAWVEYLNGSEVGKKVSKILEKEKDIYIISIILSEVIRYVKRKKGNVELAYEALIKNSRLIEITPRIAKEAGIMHFEMREKSKDFPLADALIICTAKSFKSKIITKDSHFRKFKEAEMI
ncbi:MAG: PIN domain-containing protein [Nanoarchaeota archaeon]